MRALKHPAEPGKHYGAVTAKAEEVGRALLWIFHNCPTDETIAKVDDDVVRIVDALFLDMAQQSNSGFSAEDMIDGSWVLFERGFIRLVADAGAVAPDQRLRPA
jgi:hypothetical protein